MKKKSEKKLSLGKIKVASLNENDQRMIKGGIWQLTDSVCGYQCCGSDRFAQCKTTVEGTCWCGW